jgi:L-asparaginase
VKKKVLLIYTGGTIGMEKDSETGSLAPLDLEHLEGYIPSVELLECELHSISAEEPIDSSDMHPEKWVVIAQIVRNNYDLYDGFVILHGSDTMAYTASALSFLLENLGKPVILTGSQLPVGMLRSDAQENLMSSLELAIATKDDGQPLLNEVGLYFEYKLFRGNRTNKISSLNFKAFTSPNYPWLAEMGVEMNVNHRVLLPKPESGLTLHTQLETDIAVISIYPGFNPKIITHIAEAGVKGIILRTFGVGNAPKNPELLRALKAYIDAGMPVINISQSLISRINQQKYASGRSLANIGVISGKDLTLEAGVAKLMFLLGKGLTPIEFETEFSKSLRGELTE